MEAKRVSNGSGMACDWSRVPGGGGSIHNCTRTYKKKRAGATSAHSPERDSLA
jgi:hypothetical protein